MDTSFEFRPIYGRKMFSSWICLTLFYSMLCTWTSVEGWSYYYSNSTMNWQDARAWCKEHYTDMVAIQNQKEIEHLNSWLPFKQTYYWIGIRKISDVWTWVGTNKTLTVEATNWAKGEPNNADNAQESEDCVEMYIKTKSDQKGKWNDERCGKMKTALCYTAACKNDSCHFGECVETINSHRCSCFDGFYGEKCDQVVTCKREEVTVPYQGHVNCTYQYGEFTYNSSCQYSCETGYQLTMSRPLRCTGTKQWSEQPPECKLVQCPELLSPERGYTSCSNPLGSSSYLSTCEITCNEGYVLEGSSSTTVRTQCGASGEWNVSQPTCVVAPFPAPQKLDNGFVSCYNIDLRFTPTRTCNFSCARGYHLVGPISLTDTAQTAANMSERMPRCEAIICPSPKGHSNLIPKCSRPSSELSPGSTCSFSCAPGFELMGEDAAECSDEGKWSKPLPDCKEITCPAPKIPANGHVDCSLPPSSTSLSHSPYALGVLCTFSCDIGYELQGADIMECARKGQWSSSPATCTAVSCPLLKAPENGFVNCSDSELVYSSECSFTCGQDYTLVGHKLLTCSHHGNWTEERPICQASPSVTALVSGVVSVGTVLSALSAAAWIRKQLKQKKDTFELSSNSDIEAPPTESYRNSTDSLI
ncbi:E-selectin isoform X2 [Cynoglossus semilaevis]|uniref:Selectin E n=1 Tax=Cynoglossus semilaevis TaxID=244447 RepID=A0A3P8UAN0_CYNSE|nr:E-selectin isoform X2 [Cynoglossus semilaevis]